MFFYDEHLNLHINDEPLQVSDRVKKAAADLKINLKWNDHGFINRMDHEDTTRLCEKLGIVLLTVGDYMDLLKRYPKLTPINYAEWLRDTYNVLPNGRIIGHEGLWLDLPENSPGWFPPHKVDIEGIPYDVTSSPGPGAWKYWAPYESSCALRTFDTSSRSPCLDLSDSGLWRYPNVMIRECYRHVPGSSGSGDMTRLLEEADESAAYKNLERTAYLAGKERLVKKNFDGLQTISLSDIREALVQLPPSSGYNPTFVTSYLRLDVDSVVSSVLEAVRRGRVSNSKTLCWVRYISEVVREVLGEDLCSVLEKTPKYGHQSDVVLVNAETIDERHQSQVKSIISNQHSDPRLSQVIPDNEGSWSSTLRVYLLILGSGFDFDRDVASIVMQTLRIKSDVGLDAQEMGDAERLAVARLSELGEAPLHSYTPSSISQTASNNYCLISDYKEDLFGFSVIKTDKITSYADDAAAHNACRNLPLTIVKQVQYDSKYEKVTRQHISIYFNEEFHDKGFKKAVFDVVQTACVALNGKNNVTFKEDFIIINNGQPKNSRRRLLMPLVKCLVEEHLRFFWSKSIGMYVSCGFYSYEDGEYGTLGENPQVFSGINFDDVKTLLLSTSQTSFMNLSQYWKVYRECEERRDAVTLRSLRDPSYVELLNTTFHAGRTVRHGGHDGKHVPIPEGSPALIKLEDLDVETGLPRKVIPIDIEEEESRSLWRYTSPQKDTSVATRGYAFAANQLCIDLDVGREEILPQLTFRPIYKDIIDLKYKVELLGNGQCPKVIVFTRLFSFRFRLVKLAHMIRKIEKHLPGK